MAERKQIFAHGKPNGWKCLVEYCSDKCRGQRFSEIFSAIQHSKAEPNHECHYCNTPIYRAQRTVKRNSTGIFTCNKLACKNALKSELMIGNKRTAGIKQTPERIAHRVSFIKGDKNYCWNGGVSYHHGKSQKYRLVKCPDDYKAMARKDGYVLEHRYVMAVHLGRMLLSFEVVHHINHRALDNRPENLMVFSSNSEHRKYEGETGYFKAHLVRIRTNPQNSPQPNDL